MNWSEMHIENAYLHEAGRMGIELTEDELFAARASMMVLERQGMEEAKAFARSLLAIDRLVAAWMVNAFDAEAHRNGKELDEEKKEELLLKWKKLREELPEDEAFRQATKFLRP